MFTETWAWDWGGVATKKIRLATADAARSLILRIRFYLYLIRSGAADLALCGDVIVVEGDLGKGCFVSWICFDFAEHGFVAGLIGEWGSLVKIFGERKRKCRSFDCAVRKNTRTAPLRMTLNGWVKDDASWVVQDDASLRTRSIYWLDVVEDVLLVHCGEP